MDHKVEVKTCEHWLPTGIRCAQPAMSDKNFCRHHIRFYDADDLPATGSNYIPAVPDHPDAALLSVHQATRAFLAGKIDEKTCRLLIYAAQIESSILQTKLAQQRFAQQCVNDEERLKLQKEKIYCG